MTSTRWLAPVVAVLLALTLSGCSNDDKADKPKSTLPQGILTKSDMPFDATSDGSLGRPPILTQLGTSCLGIEQGVLYDAGWKVKAHEYFDSVEWTVISAVFTPPADAGDGLAQVRTKTEDCIPREKKAKVAVLDLGDDAWGYEITTPEGEFNAARAYTELSGGRLAQVSVMKLPKGKDVTPVLQDLVDKVD